MTTEREEVDGKIGREEIRRLANLARISMSSSQEEEERMREDISSILGYFHTIDGIEDATQVDDDATSLKVTDLRDDEVVPSDPDKLLKGVPHRKGRLVRAPRVF
jgi:aspartyl/glutamyl-tRNA(Asn/Gln) amidotransferase C subunit